MPDPALIAHIVRRMTFAARPFPADEFGEIEPAALIEQLLGGSPLSPDEPELGTDDDYSVLIRWWLDIMARPDAGIHERMVWFWHGHLTSSLDRTEPALMLRQHRLLREHALGNFRELLQAMTIDAAMLHWLDGNYSQSWGPNENFSREVMELFALGRGNYTEADVRAGAYLFSGWYVDGENANTVTFDPDNGPQEPREFLGRSVTSATEAIDAICDHEACASYVAGRVYASFVGIEPDDDVRASLATEFRDSGLDIATLVASVVRHPSFLEHRMNRPRTAVEFFLAARAVLETRLDHWILDPMGQVPFRPPNVAGWPGAARWLSSGAVFTKVQLAYDNSWDTVTIDSDEPVDAVLAKAGLYEVSPETRSALVDAISGIESRRDRSTLLHALAVASPEFSIA